MNSKLRKNENILMKQTLTENGITLIALVVTIVVLLILASVSITVVFGDNGILQLAKEAGEKTNEAVKNDKEQIEEMGDIINDYLEAPKTVEEAIKRNYAFKENTDIIDKYGNPITIPAGFRIVPNGTDFVEYNYDEDENGSKTHIPTVQDGIVIEDAKENEYGEKNQFVWIPICIEKKDEDGNITIERKIKNKDNTESEIILGRYIFAIGDYVAEDGKYNGTGKETLKQDALNYLDISDNTKIDDCYQELESSEYGNAVAKSLSTFVKRANEKGGYYLARYEAVKGTDENVKSMQSTKASATDGEQEIKAGMVWANITQLDASTKSQNMYGKNTNFETDLVNSYAWDTAIVFIQMYSIDKDYSKQNILGFTEEPVKTGERDTTTDKRCNIYDMASNMMEWTTETATAGDRGVKRGGYYCELKYVASSRAFYIVPYSHTWSFRPLLYFI